MTPPPMSAVLLLGLIATFVGWLCWRYFWRRHARPVSVSAAVFAAFMAVLFACFPGVLLIQALATGEVQCLGRRCGELHYALLTEPVGYWLRVVLLALACAFALSSTPVIRLHQRKR
ncbi:hypothetical protein ACCQ10_20090 [Xanthomonas sp. NCPPB 1325]|uniref:hypothetical protein n=1 Tax=Xanthomonas sp. NCPPB 1325 TaxID=487529 RepID=UPI00355815C6